MSSTWAINTAITQRRYASGQPAIGRTWRGALAAMAAFAAILLHAIQPASAGAAFMFEVNSDRVLFADEPDRPWYPASLTKLMTAYIAFEEIKAGRLTLSSQITQSAHSQKEPPSKIGMPVGNSISLGLGLSALVIKSANDVAMMIGEKISGSETEFVKRMNLTASRLGMKRTRFRNPNGLPDNGQVTTARDMALLTRAIIREFPEHADLFKQSRMKFGKIPLRSHNRILETFYGADGMKTGFICASGFNVVASATRDGRRLVAVVLGASTAPERTKRVEELLEYGFRTAPWYNYFTAETIESLPRSPAKVIAPKDIRGEVEVWACGYRPSKKGSRSRNQATVGDDEAEDLRGTTATAATEPAGHGLRKSAFRQN